MKTEFNIKIDKLEDIITFSKLLSEKVQNDVLAYCGNNIVDAKYIFGLLCVCSNSDNIVKVKLFGKRTPDLINFNEICKHYEV